MNKINIDIKQIRENQRLTQSEFAEILGVSRSTITKIEGGEVQLSKSMLKKLEINFPENLGLPYDNSNLISNENESDILIGLIALNLGRIEEVKRTIKKMSLNTDYEYTNEVFLSSFLATSQRLNFSKNEQIFNSVSVKYNYRFLQDFLTISKSCLFSIYEDLFNFASIKYLYAGV